MTADPSNAAVIISGDDGDGDVTGGVDSTSAGLVLRSQWSQVVTGGLVQGLVDSDTVTALNVTSPAVVEVATAEVVGSPVVEEVATAVVVGTPVVEVSEETVVEVVVPVETETESSEGSNGCNGEGVTKSVWGKPAGNGDVEGTVSPVMGAVSWPALSETARTGPKVFTVSSSEGLFDTTVEGSAAVSQAPVIVQPPPKQVKRNLKSHTNPNNNRPKPVRGGGSVGGASVGPPPFPVFDTFGNLVPVASEFPQPAFKNNKWSARTDDRTWNRDPPRRNSFGPRPGYGGRRDNSGPRSPSPRDAYIPYQFGPQPVRGFVPQPFIPHQQAYGPPMAYEMGASYVYIPIGQEPYTGGAPFSPHGASGPVMFIPYWNPYMHGSILKQIEYYFSDENLAKDNFLKSQMDDEGWVPIKLIAGFQRVQKLTNDMQIILSSLLYSNTVEVQGDKIRRRADWRRWIHIPGETTVEEASLQKLTLEDGPINEKEVLANVDNS